MMEAVTAVDPSANISHSARSGEIELSNKVKYKSVADTDTESKDIQIQIESPTPPTTSERVVSSYIDRQRLSSASEDTLASSPEIIWTDLSFSVGPKNKKKQILANCWGRVAPNTLVAIMGASGCGKSSLLNVIAGRISSRSGIHVEGKIYVARNQINPVVYRKNIAYVMQFDSLLPTLTPREHMFFNAALKLPSCVTIDDLSEKVDKLLEKLDLLNCADTLVGGELMVGISGGEKKRVSVGIELITDPHLLLLDEPTSGLDSFATFGMIKLLHKLSRRSCSTLCSVHQPSSEAFYMFDSVIVLRKGRIFYQGEVRDVVKYFESIGYECPKNYNPSDFIVSLSHTLSNEEIEEKGLTGACTAELLFLNSPLLRIREKDIYYNLEGSFFKQLMYLTVRELKVTYRDVIMLSVRFGMTLSLNLLFALVFLGAGNRYLGNSENFSGHFGAITILMLFAMAAPAQPILISLRYERPVFLREFANGTYGIVVYVLSKLLVEVPIVFAQNSMQLIICYWAMGLQGKFIFLLLSLFGLSMGSSSLAFCLGSSMSNVKTIGEFFYPLLFIPQVLFVGYFISTSQIPSFISWGQYLCSLKYGMDLVLLTEFDYSLPHCQVDFFTRRTCQGVLSANNITYSQMPVYIFLLVGLSVAFRVIGGWNLARKAVKYL